MQQHEEHDPRDRHQDPWGKQTRWLLLAIAILLGLVLSVITNRLF
jgi:hypothetical protein